MEYEEYSIEISIFMTEDRVHCLITGEESDIVPYVESINLARCLTGL
jgi:hypothetical protein